MAWPVSSGCLAFDQDRPGPALDLPVPGRHNLLNARAALAALELAGFELEPRRARWPRSRGCCAAWS